MNLDVTAVALTVHETRCYLPPGSCTAANLTWEDTDIAYALIHLRAYRERHRIELSLFAHADPLCRFDRIKVIARRDGTWRHDPTVIHRLVARTAGHA